MAYTPERFAVALLGQLGIQPTRRNVKALVGWQRAEGGHWHNTARYNPLNTTQNMPGSGDTGTQGNISVYRNWRQGVEATERTLENGRYGGILQALRNGTARDVASAINASPWGTHGSLVYQAIASTPKPARLPVARGQQRVPTAPRVPQQQRASGGLSVPSPDLDNLVAPQEQQSRPATPLDAPEFSAARMVPSGLPIQSGTGGAQTGNALVRELSDIRSRIDPSLAPVSSVKVTGRKARQLESVAHPPTERLGDSFTRPGSMPDRIRTFMERAAAIDAKQYPYVWGGGHGKSGTPSIGIPGGPGYDGKTIGFDCSGAVAAVLGVDPRHSSQFAQWGKPGRAKNGRGITVYANSSHVLMEINGRFWGTSGSNPRGGAGWIPRSAISNSYLSKFTARHM